MIQYRISGNLNVVSFQLSTNDIFTDDIADTPDFENDFVDLYGICIECRQDHRFKVKFDDVKTSIDIIPELWSGALIDGERMRPIDC